MEKYNVLVFTKTIMNEFHLSKTVEFDNMEEARRYGDSEAEKGNRVRLEKITTLIVWH